MNKLVIIGAGGHGKVIADLAMRCGYCQICFLDDGAAGYCVGFPICGTSAAADSLNDGSTDFVIGIGNNFIRKKIVLAHPTLNYVTLVHPSAIVGMQVQVGPGSVVMAGAIINSCARIGDHCIVNTGAILEHDNVIESFVHISPRAALGGTVRVGQESHIGIGAVVRNNIDICSGCVIGAGAVVVKNIGTAGTYVGVPAVQMDKR